MMSPSPVPLSQGYHLYGHRVLLQAELLKHERIVFPFKEFTASMTFIFDKKAF